MFCHEGPWHKVDRIWTIKSDGTDKKLIHQREYTMEIAGHEFFSADGKWIWYDLQTPRSVDFWVAGYEIATGKRVRYHLTGDEWGVHFNVSPDGALFSQRRRIAGHGRQIEGWPVDQPAAPGDGRRPRPARSRFHQADRQRRLPPREAGEHVEA
jgi:hypothetical protein